MFFEARSDGELGMETVAKNVLTRLNNKFRGANTICDVVNSPKQYSYLWDGVEHTVRRAELQLYNKVLSFAHELVYLYTNDILQEDWYKVGDCEAGATHYHRWDIAPKWSDPSRGSMDKFCGRVGSHLFFVGK